MARFGVAIGGFSFDHADEEKHVEDGNEDCVVRYERVAGDYFNHHVFGEGYDKRSPEKLDIY